MSSLRDASCIVLNIGCASVLVMFAALCAADLVQRVSDIGAYQQIAIDCVRSL
jgi:hypothetical protein